MSHDPQSPTDAADFDPSPERPFCAYIGGTCNGRHACCDDPDDDGEYEDCGLMPNGQCTKAGSEECDWDCGALHADEDDGCCPGCGECPGFTGVDCDETCEWATTGGGAA